MNVEKIYLLQDKILQVLGKLDIPFVFSGSTPLSRAFFNHRNSFDLQFFSEKGELDYNFLNKILKELESDFNVKSKDETKKYIFPQPVDTYRVKVFDKEDTKKENPVEIEFLQDLFNGKFNTVNLDFGIKLEELEGIYFRKLIDFFNNPKDVGTVLDILVMDEEYPLEDFFKEFQGIIEEKGFKIEQNQLYGKIKIFKEELEKDIIKIDKELKFLGSVIDVHHLRKWINSKTA